VRELPRPLPRVAGVPRGAVDACRDTIAAQAVRYGAVRVEAASAGSLRRARNGMTQAPIAARIVYARWTSSRSPGAGRLFSTLRDLLWHCYEATIRTQTVLVRASRWPLGPTDPAEFFC
jgi:hypothetical protein